VLEYRSIPHQGGVNRVRVQYIPDSNGLPPVTEPYYTATWADTGRVHVWNVRPLMESLEVPGYQIDKARTHKPVCSVTSHKKAEGFALDWSPHFVRSDPSSLKLLSGDIHAKIFLTIGSPTGFSTSSQPFSSHTNSVEDLQWSPSEQTVFASCSSDRSIRIWDTRVKGKTSVVGVSAAHDSDVNVISWNKITSYLLVSGGDEGRVKIWDLRSLKGYA
jgi:ribosome assembly protein RRB1